MAGGKFSWEKRRLAHWTLPFLVWAEGRVGGVGGRKRREDGLKKTRKLPRGWGGPTGGEEKPKAVPMYMSVRGGGGRVPRPRT